MATLFYFLENSFHLAIAYIMFNWFLLYVLKSLALFNKIWIWWTRWRSMWRDNCWSLLLYPSGLLSCKFINLGSRILWNILIVSNFGLYDNYDHTFYSWNRYACEVKPLFVCSRQIKYWQYDPWNMIKFDKLALYIKHLPFKMTCPEI